MATITSIQTKIINEIKLLLTGADYKTIRDNIIEPVSSTDFPLIIVDIATTLLEEISSGKYCPSSHMLVLTCYSALGSSGIGTARDNSCKLIEKILNGIQSNNIVESKIEYTDSVLSNIKVCAAGCLLEFNDSI